MKPIVFTKLSLMMLLQYFIWGSWYVTMATYMSVFLQSSGVQIGAAYSALAIATMISPFFIGMVADRYFAAQRIMGVLHLLGGGLLFLATQISDNTLFYWIIVFYSLLYMPTIALSNSIAFQQMTDPGKQFPWIRVFGTVGWIVAGLMIGALAIEKTPATFYMAAIASVGLGIISFVLPNTPPKGKNFGKCYWCRGVCAFQGQVLSRIFYCRYFSVHPTFLLLRFRQFIFERLGHGKRRQQNDHGPNL